MIDERAKMLIATIRKLYHRDAKQNIQRIFAKTHEADVASIIDGFDLGERFDLFRMVGSAEKQSEVLSRVELDVQKEILSCLSKQEILQLVELMDTDDAADLLGQIPEEESKEILASMGKEDSDEVADLMGYPEDTAGALMSSDYLALHEDLTVAQSIKEIQSEEADIGVAFYIYVINDNNQLVGVLSLKQLLLSKPNDALRDLMSTEVISVTDDTPQERVAKVVEHYDFLSIPVVDQGNGLLGVITVDDIIDVIREEAEENLLAMGQAGLGVDASTFERLRARLGWLIMALAGGMMCFAIVYIFGVFADNKSGGRLMWVVAAYIPLLLSIGATTGSQAATVTVGALRSGKLENFNVKSHLWKEAQLSLVFAIFFGVLVFLLTTFILPEHNVSWVFSLAMALQILVSMGLGNIVPMLIVRMGLDPSVASIPVYATFADVSAMAVLFGLFHSIY